MRLPFAASLAVLIAIMTFSKGPSFWNQSLSFCMAATGALVLIIMYAKDQTITPFVDPVLWLMIFMPAFACVTALAHQVPAANSMGIGIFALVIGWLLASVLKRLKVIR